MGTQCKCARPPGGETNCPENHVAICRKIDGECRGTCQSVNIQLKPEEIMNFLIRIITDDPNRSLNKSIGQEEINTLRSGYYQYSTADYKTVEVRFNLPKEVVDMLDMDTLPGVVSVY